MFHSLFQDEREIASEIVDPYQPLRVSDFKRVLQYFLEYGYRFVTPAHIESGLDMTGRYAFVTFDDGYANNLHALPVLKELGVPATFFVSVNHVATGMGFWWDALYRVRRRSGVAVTAIRREQATLKRRTFRDIDAYVRAECGARGLQPVGDIDRPLTPAELWQLACEPLVTLGNHTADHAVLTVHDDREVRAQIRACQEYLAALTGTAPRIIAYPNGSYDARVCQLARAEGLRLGVVVEPRKNRLPITDGAAMTLGRYFLRGGSILIEECQLCRSDLQLLHQLRRAFNVHR